MKDGRDHVTIEDFEASLDEILADCDLALRRSYQAAIETSGEVRVRKSVMEAMALLNDLEVPFKAIRESFLKFTRAIRPPSDSTSSVRTSRR